MFAHEKTEEYRKFMLDFIKAMKEDCENKLDNGDYYNENYMQGKIDGLEECIYKIEKSEFLTNPEMN